MSAIGKNTKKKMVSGELNVLQKQKVEKTLFFHNSLGCEAPTSDPPLRGRRCSAKMYLARGAIGNFPGRNKPALIFQYVSLDVSPRLCGR